MALILKQYRPEFAIYISVFAGLMILGYCFQKIATVISLLQLLVNTEKESLSFLPILLKMTGIAYLVEFTSNTCLDAGESAIASKVELAGRLLIMTMALPIMGTLLESFSKLL